LSPNLTQKPYPPLLIGGGGEKRTLKLVAKYADIWNIPSVPPIEYSRKLSVLKSHCENLGTNYSRIEKTMESRILITDKGINDEIIDWFRYFLKTADQVVPTRQESKEIIESNFMIGSLDECKEKISNYIEEGVQHFTLYFLDFPSYKSLELLSDFEINHD
jgi:alkanesulfonate monooxygenase SsuD/methylene tetrahydromethanopterin reductase-like flavin-dependent oxidoreductase (luciferase family)